MLKSTTFASTEVRETIIGALRDEGRRFIARHDTTSRGYLDKLELTEEGLCLDLAEQLEIYELELKPKTNPNDKQKYRFLLHYTEFEDLPAVNLHITLSSRGEPPRVKIELHPHNTGYDPIKPTLLKSDS